MLLFIEGYPYALNYNVRGGLTVKDILEGIVSFPQIEKTQLKLGFGLIFKIVFKIKVKEFKFNC